MMLSKALRLALSAVLLSHSAAETADNLRGKTGAQKKRREIDETISLNGVASMPFSLTGNATRHFNFDGNIPANTEVTCTVSDCSDLTLEPRHLLGFSVRDRSSLLASDGQTTCDLSDTFFVTTDVNPVLKVSIDGPSADKLGSQVANAVLKCTGVAVDEYLTLDAGHSEPFTLVGGTAETHNFLLDSPISAGTEVTCALSGCTDMTLQKDVELAMVIEDDAVYFSTSSFHCDTSVTFVLPIETTPSIILSLNPLNGATVKANSMVENAVMECTTPAGRHEVEEVPMDEAAIDKTTKKIQAEATMKDKEEAKATIRKLKAGATTVKAEPGVRKLKVETPTDDAEAPTEAPTAEGTIDGLEANMAARELQTSVPTDTPAPSAAPDTPTPCPFGLASTFKKLRNTLFGW